MGTYKNPFESNGFICGRVGHVRGCPFRGSRTKNLPLGRGMGPCGLSQGEGGRGGGVARRLSAALFA